MPTKTISLDQEAYEHLKAHKREGESFSDAVARLIGGRSLRDLRDVFDDEQVSEMREAIETADQDDRAEVNDVAARFG